MTRYKGREWAPISLDLYRHPDLAAASAAASGALGLFVGSILWSIENDTNGYLPRYAVDQFAAGMRRPARDAAVAALVKTGRYEAANGGWHIHHFAEHQSQTVLSRARYQANRDRFENGS